MTYSVEVWIGATRLLLTATGTSVEDVEAELSQLFPQADGIYATLTTR